MEIVVGFYAFIGLIIWFLHNMVDEKIGTSAKDHVDFWVEMIVILAVGFAWIFPPYLFLQFGAYDWIADISFPLMVLVSILVWIFWWVLPFIAFYIIQDIPIDLISRLSPIDRRLCANYERATAFYKGTENGKPKFLSSRIDEFDPPEEEVFDENGIEIPPITTPREAKDYLFEVEAARTERRGNIYKALKKRTRAITWRLFLLALIFITAFYVFSYFKSRCT